MNTRNRGIAAVNGTARFTRFGHTALLPDRQHLGNLNSDFGDVRFRVVASSQAKPVASQLPLANVSFSAGSLVKLKYADWHVEASAVV